MHHVAAITPKEPGLLNWFEVPTDCDPATAASSAHKLTRGHCFSLKFATAELPGRLIQPRSVAAPEQLLAIDLVQIVIWVRNA